MGITEGLKKEIAFQTRRADNAVAIGQRCKEEADRAMSMVQAVSQSFQDASMSSAEVMAQGVVNRQRLSDAIEGIQVESPTGDEEPLARDLFESGALDMGVVYMIRRRSDSFTKVGTTINPRARLVSLEAEHGPLSVRAVHVGGFRLENSIHAQLDRWRVEGEWFRDNKVLDELVEEAPTECPYLWLPQEFHDIWAKARNRRT